MSASISSYIPTGNATGTRARDQLSFSVSGTPQPMTLYCKFISRVVDTSSRVIVQVGSVDTTNPRFLLLATTSYACQYRNAAGTVVSSSLIAPAVGSLVELRGLIDVTGSVTIGMTTNGSAETLGTPSGPQVLPLAWASNHLMLNSAGTAAVNFIEYLAIAIVRGVQSLDTMRRVAGTHTR